MPSLVTLRAEEATEWSKAVAQSWRYDFYHLSGYHALARDQGEGDARLFVYRDGDFTISLPLLLRPVDERPADPETGDRWLDATSVYGYPGPIQSHRHIPSEVLHRFGRYLVETLRELRVVSVFSRLNPLIPQAETLAGMGECPAVGETVSICLTRPAEELWSGYRANHRRHISRNRRLGLRCEHDTAYTHLDEFIDLYYETMRRVDARPSYFFDRSYFTYLCSAMRQHVQLFVAELDGCVVSAGLFTVYDGIVQYHLGGTRNAYLQLSPLKSVLDAVRVWGAKEGMRVLHLGGGTGARDDDLFAFKAGFSADRNLFRVWKWIVMPDVYERLVAERDGAGGSDPWIHLSDYFPAYRVSAQ